MVRDRETLEPTPAEASYISIRMRDLGILLGTDGPYHNVVKIRPPMPFDGNDAARLVETMERVLRGCEVASRDQRIPRPSSPAVPSADASASRGPLGPPRRAFALHSSTSNATNAVAARCASGVAS